MKPSWGSLRCAIRVEEIYTIKGVLVLPPQPKATHPIQPVAHETYRLCPPIAPENSSPGQKLARAPPASRRPHPAMWRSLVKKVPSKETPTHLRPTERCPFGFRPCSSKVASLWVHFKFPPRAGPNQYTHSLVHTRPFQKERSLPTRAWTLP